MKEQSTINNINKYNNNCAVDQIASAKHSDDSSVDAMAIERVDESSDKLVGVGAPSTCLSPMERINWILSDTSPASVVARMAVQDVFCLIKDAGLADASEIVALASPEQFQGFIDLDGWQKDSIAMDDTAAWIRALALGGCQDTGARLVALDKEYLDSFMSRIIRVWDLSDSLEEANLPEGDRLLMTTPDQAFAVELLDPDFVDVAKTILDSLTETKGPFWVSKYLAGLRWELLSETEEAAYGWRRGRMEDMGFPEYYRALEVLRGMPLDSPRLDGVKTRIRLFREGQPTMGMVDNDLLGTPPRYLAERMGADGLWGKALEQVTDRRVRDRVVQGLARLVNSIMVAEGVDPGEMDDVQGVLGLAKAYLNLGFEALAGNEPETVADLLGEAVLVDVFRVGLGVVEELRRAAKALAGVVGSLREGAGDGGMDGEHASSSLLEPEQEELLDYLQAANPVLLTGQHFSCMAEIADAYQLLRDIESVLP